ncbi:MAG: hypothetical protein IJB00_00370 [Akkermansia sp.]|nr:hypothetical protein [Akkermansia sp.]
MKISSHYPLILGTALFLTGAPLFAAVAFPGPKPGKAEAADDGNGKLTLSNNVLRAEFHKNDKGIILSSLKDAAGKTLVTGTPALFTVQLHNGKTYSSGDFSCEALTVTPLEKDKKNVNLAKRQSGQSISANFTAPDKSFSIQWQAVLRNGSHYLRQEFRIQAAKNVEFDSIIPLSINIKDGGDATVSGNTTHGNLVVNERIFTGLETPMSIMSVSGQGGSGTSVGDATVWSPDSFGEAFHLEGGMATKYGKHFTEKDGPTIKNLGLSENSIQFTRGGKCELSFQQDSGDGGLHLLGVQLLSEEGQLITEDIHQGTTGISPQKNTYTIQVPSAGTYTLRYWVNTRQGAVACGGQVKLSLPIAESEAEAANSSDNLVQGTWKRRTTLHKGEEWEVSSVIGLFAPQQQRRSFLAYHERERVQPWKLLVHYNDWYEIGIVVHDHQDPAKRTNESMWMKLLDIWQKNLVQKHKVAIDCFVIDDGWDEFNSLWDFHCGFPRGFAAMDKSASRMKAGLGTWLGPVGGYGASKAMRIGHWNKTHPNNQISSFQLSNKEYFNAFAGRCKDMVKKYNMRYFKFDGISTKFHAKGPAAPEDAEGIISVIKALREQKPDLFINTSVGTWASPFWFHVSDSVWRQENDFGQTGSMGDERDRWINYRDNLVYEVFVEGAPFCPINSLMTHGTIITKNGPPKVMSKSPTNCIKEMRTAFGCGSALQELYVDSDLMMQENGRLWKELADCIRWIRRNQDVLPDIHWVGGKPWDGTDGSVYGWAAWNSKKCTLTLRNSSDSKKSLNGSLREILDIPPGYKGAVVLTSSFADQRKPDIIGKALDVDKNLEIELDPFEVIVMEGINELSSADAGDSDDEADDTPQKSKKKKGKKKKKKKQKK